MFRYLQSRIRGTATTGPGVPPPSLIAFYWHFVRQTRGWYPPYSRRASRSR